MCLGGILDLSMQIELKGRGEDRRPFGGKIGYRQEFRGFFGGEVYSARNLGLSMQI
jgi:hypothetical protein